MSKRIVLKSSIAVVLLGFVLVFSSCKKEEKQIIGKWKCEKVELKEFSCTDPEMEMMLRMIFQMGASEMAKEMGLETIEFTKDGKMISKSETAKYKVNGNKLTITDSENVSGTIDISFEKKTMYWDMDLLKLAGEDAVDLLESGVTKCVLRVTFAKQ